MVGGKANSTVRFKTMYFEKFILWEIAARKLDSSPVGIDVAAASEHLGTVRRVLVNSYLSQLVP